MPRKRTLFFFSIVIMSFIIMTFQSKKGHGPTDNILSRLLDYSHGAAKSVTDAIKGPFETMSVREEENNRLQKRVDELMLERGKYLETVRENKRLKEILGLKEKTVNYVTTSRVIARGIDRWAHVFVIDKGLNDGIQKDMTAITPKGLAGKVFTVSGSHASLLLLTDMNFSVSVRIQETRKEGILSGTGTRKCILKYIPYEDEVKTGDVLVTSGLDSLFPPGIPVGYVSKVDKTGKGGDLQYIEALPFQDNSKIEEVIIVK